MDDFTGGAGALRLSSRHSDGAFTITAVGDLDFATAAQLLNCADSVFIQLAHLPRRPPGRQGPGDDPHHDPGEGHAPGKRMKAVVIDVSGVAFIDACGLGTLVTIASTARHRHLSFALAAPSAAVRRILAITDMRHRFLTLPACPPGALGLDPGLDLGGTG
ncbi:STAS domain-containing protein [Spirillospora sp. NPDC127200]